MRYDARGIGLDEWTTGTMYATIPGNNPIGVTDRSVGSYLLVYKIPT
jgi:hypothetical protein